MQSTRTSFTWLRTGSIISSTALAALALGGCVEDVDGDSEDPSSSVDQDVVTSGGADRVDLFVMDNSPTRNAVIAFHRAVDGTLTRVAAFPTGGQGTGAGLGSQGSVVLDADGTHLFAVNPGSNSFSVFELKTNVLVLRDIVPSGGANPISLTVHDDLLFVLNAGRDAAPGRIAGFRLGDESATPLTGSRRYLSADAVGPAQIQFSPAGDVLVVTEKATNNITTFTVDPDGRASLPIVTPSSGQTPFGFAFDANGTLIVSEAFGGAPGASALSSYALGADGVPHVISASVPNGQGASCWVAIGPQPYAYATNTGSASVSGYHITPTGAITLLGDGGVTGMTGANPTDVDFNATGKFLYVLDAGSDSIHMYSRGTAGALISLGQVTGLPAPTVGMAVR